VQGGDVARIFGLGGLISAEVGVKTFRSENKIPPAAGSINQSNIITFIYIFETNLAKNISPSPKGLMGFILYGGLYFCFVGLSPPPPQAHAWLHPWDVAR